MARTKRSRRSYGAGEWGRNRVRIFPDPKTGLFQIEWRENGRRLTRSLKHRDWKRAKRQADQFAAGFIDAPNGKAEAEPEPVTLEKLSGGIPRGGLAVPRGAGARARDGAPYRCNPPASMARHRLRGRDHPLARRARQVGLRAHHADHRRGSRPVEGGAGEEPRHWGGPGTARAQESEGGCGGRPVARLVEQGPDSCRTGAAARTGLALAAAEVRQRPDGPAVEGALPTWRVEDGQDGASVLPKGRRGTASEGSGRPTPGSGLRSRMAGGVQRESGLPNTQMQSPQEDANLHGNASPAPHHSRCSGGLVHGRLAAPAASPRRTDRTLLRGIDVGDLALAEQDGTHLSVQKLPRLGLAGVQAEVVDQQRLVLQPVAPALRADLLLNAVAQFRAEGRTCDGWTRGLGMASTGDGFQVSLVAGAQVSFIGYLFQSGAGRSKPCRHRRCPRRTM